VVVVALQVVRVVTALQTQAAVVRVALILEQRLMVEMVVQAL
jgi:hypothetical protein